MVNKEINMHGRLYQLHDEIERTKEDAQQVASDIRDKGMICFLNPRKRKNIETTYFIYSAQKAERKPKKPKTTIVVDGSLLTAEVDEVELFKPEETDEGDSVFIESPIIKEISTLNDIEQVIEATKSRAKNLKICKTCGNEFLAKNSRNVYCKKSCRPSKK